MRNVLSISGSICIFFMMLCACGTKYPVNQRGFTSIQQGMLYYCNDDLQMGFEFFGNEIPADSLTCLVLNSTEERLLKINAIDKAQYLLSSSNPHGNIRKLLYIPKKQKKQKRSIDYLKYGKDSLVFWYKTDTYQGLKYLNALYTKDQYQYGLLTFYDTTDFMHQFLRSSNQFETESLMLIARSVRGLHQGKFNCECTVDRMFEETFTSCDERNFLTANILSNKMQFFSDPVDQYHFRSKLALYHCFAGQHDLALQTFRLQPLPFKRPKSIKKTLPQVQSITDYIKDEDSLVMINSLPMLAKHRYWQGSQLQNLYNKGYRYLALDALLPNHNINQLGFATTDDGFRMMDPSYGNLVRQAHRIGYKIVGLDSMDISNKCHVLFEIIQKAKIVYLTEPETPVATISTYILNYLYIDQVSGEYIPNSMSEGVFLISSDSQEISVLNNLNYFDHCFSLLPLSKAEVSISIADITKHSPVKPTDQWAICIYLTNELQSKIASVPTYIRIEQPISHFDALLSKGKYTLKVKNKYGLTIYQHNFEVND